MIRIGTRGSALALAQCRDIGPSETAVHALTVLFGLLCIPAGLWAGWSLFVRRAGLYMAILCAFSTFLTAYAQEGRMYELMGLLGTIFTTMPVTRPAAVVMSSTSAPETTVSAPSAWACSRISVPARKLSTTPTVGK